MKTIILGFVATCLITGASFAQTSGQAASSQSSSASANRNGVSGQGTANGDASGTTAIAPGSTIPVALAKPIDARKNKPGDEVVAKTTKNIKSDNQMIIPKGSKIVGHVTEAKSRTKSQGESAVGIVFDHAVLKDGRQVPMAASIQALSRPEQNAAAASSMAEEPIAAGGSVAGMGSGRAAAPASGLAGNGLGSAGRTVGGATGEVGGTTGTVGNAGSEVGQTGGTLNNTTGGAVNATNSAGSMSSGLTSASHGVIGMSGLALNSAANSSSGVGSATGSVISSTTSNVHLDSGTQMILQVVR